MEHIRQTIEVRSHGLFGVKNKTIVNPEYARMMASSKKKPSKSQMDRSRTIARAVKVAKLKEANAALPFNKQQAVPAGIFSGTRFGGYKTTRG